MTTPKLAKIERVPDLRGTWPNEAQHFTPWLADNIAELGAALGMDLEMQQIEAPVGGYSLDILATDLGSSRPVIIENQLEATDHSHLGQLLTYAAGFDAEAVVWVTREFRDEHRQALDWLNQRTGEDTQFFGIAVELWRIGDSLPAPHFNVVATPNGWRKESAGRLSGNIFSGASERAQRYGDFFQDLLDVLREKHNFTNDRKAPTRNWVNFSLGIRAVTIGANFTGQKEARVEIYLNDRDGERNFRFLDGLRLQREEIQSQLGVLDWQPLEGKKACRIALTRPGSIDDDDDTLAEIQVWMVDNLLRFKDVFTPRLAELSRQEY
ncbi:MAG: DUF4268 domain-containing protein [Chloroflexota bacterium]|nr:DUF4268 domain-containing protein [Chloroflexota bacterium]